MHRKLIKSKVESLKLLCLIETDKAWLAGFIDGEGTITLFKCRGKWLSPAIEIENTCKEALIWTKELLGYGSDIRIHERKKSQDRKIVWYYNVFGVDNVGNILKVILPYLKVKKKQAELLKLYCDEHIPYGGTTGIEWEIYYDLKELNKKGR